MERQNKMSMVEKIKEIFEMETVYHTSGAKLICDSSYHISLVPEKDVITNSVFDYENYEYAEGSDVYDDDYILILGQSENKTIINRCIYEKLREHGLWGIEGVLISKKSTPSNAYPVFLEHFDYFIVIAPVVEN